MSRMMTGPDCFQPLPVAGGIDADDAYEPTGSDEEFNADVRNHLTQAGGGKGGGMCVMARAKRERVVQDGVEKANRRHGTTRPGTPRSLFEI